MDYYEKVWVPVTQHMNNEVLYYTDTFYFPMMEMPIIGAYPLMGQIWGVIYMFIGALPLWLWIYTLVPFFGWAFAFAYYPYIIVHWIMTAAMFTSGYWAPFVSKMVMMYEY